MKTEPFRVAESAAVYQVIQKLVPKAAWRWTTMGEIADVIGGGTPRTNDASNFDEGDIPWLTPADLSGYAGKYVSRGARFITKKGLESSSARILPAGAVLFTSRAPIGYVAIASNPIATNQGFKSFVLKGGVLPEYVYWWLRGAKQIAESLASGTTFLELSGANAKKLPIPIAPIEQQRKIVAKIEKQFSRLDDAVANLKRVKANLKRHKAAVLKAAVAGEVVVRSKNWPKVFLGEVAQIIDPQPSHRTPPIYPNGIPYVGLGDIDANEKIDFKKARKVHPDVLEEHRVRYTLAFGDFVFGKIGTIGRPARLQPPFDYALSANLVLIQPKTDELHPGFAFLLMASPQIAFLSAMASNATTQAAFGIKRIRQIQIELPPMEEQIAISQEVDRRLTFIHGIETAVEVNLTRAESLRKSALTKVFQDDQR